MKTKLNRKKTKQLLMYLAGRVDIGKTKLMKLLYLIDFTAYEKTGKSITNDKYEHWSLGPVPTQIWHNIEGKLSKGILHKESIETPRGNYVKFTPAKSANLKGFSRKEKQIIDEIIEKYGGKNQDELVRMVHDELPYLITQENEEIPYFLSTYRNYKKLTKEQIERLKNNEQFITTLNEAYAEYTKYYAFDAA